MRVLPCLATAQDDRLAYLFIHDDELGSPRRRGRAGVAFSLEGARVSTGETVLFERGRLHDGRARLAAAALLRPEVVIGLDLGARGPHSATMWTCDLSAEYVWINAENRT